MFSILFSFLIIHILAQTFVNSHNPTYMIGINKELIQELLDKNLRVIIDHVDEQMNDHSRLKGSALQSELFFDQGEIVYEVQGLSVVSGQMEGEQESCVSIEGKVELAQIVVRLQQGRLEVSDVVFQVEMESLVFEGGGKGDEEEVKQTCAKVLMEQIKKREEAFKLVLGKVERDIRTTFSQKKMVASSKLEQTMSLEGDRLVMSYWPQSEHDAKTRRAQGRALQFSPEPQHMRDVQYVIHESYVSQLLQTLIPEKATFSFTDFMFAILSETCGWIAIVALRSLMSTNVLSIIFPELGTQFGLNRKVDLSCGFKPPDHDVHALKTEAFFKDGNILEANLNFGCSLKVSEATENYSTSRDPESVFAFIDAMALDPASSSYPHIFRSFFFSMATQTEFDFSEDVNKFAPFGLEDGINMNKDIPYIFGTIKRFDANFEECRLYGIEEDHSLKVQMNQKLTKIKKMLDDAPTALQKMTNAILNQGIPLVPFPEVEDCLGLGSKDSSMEIVDGYAILAYDFDIKAANEHCLFKIEERRLSDKERQTRILQDGEDVGESRFEIYGKLRQRQSDHLLRLTPGIPSFSIPNARDMIRVDALLGGPLASRAELLVQDLANQNFEKYKNLQLEDFEIPVVNLSKLWELIK